MPRYGHGAGASSGFTLLEVILASAILATSLAAVVAVYVRTAENAAAARDLTVAASTARNAMEEAFADYAETEELEDGLGVEGPIPERPSLRLLYWRSPLELDEEEMPLTDEFYIDVTIEGRAILSWGSRRALYLGADEEGDDERHQAGEGEGADE